MNASIGLTGPEKFAVWLIVKGFNPEAVEPLATEPDSGRIDMSGTIRPSATTA